MAEQENQQLATMDRSSRPLAKQGFTFLPTTWAELYNYAKEISTTDFVPNAYRGKPAAVLAAWQKGAEVGLPAMAALESIAIVNGRPSIHSNGFWALVISHPLCEWFNETPPDQALKQGYGECTIKRRGNANPIVRRFTMEEAKTAGLLGKDNWKNYPGDMLQNRARHRASDDAIPEACQGLLPADVARDLDPVDVTPKEEPKPIATPQPLKKKETASDHVREAVQGSDGARAQESKAVPASNSEPNKEASGSSSEGQGETQTAEAQPEEKPKVTRQRKAKDEDHRPAEGSQEVAQSNPAGDGNEEGPTAGDVEKSIEDKILDWIKTCSDEEIGEKINFLTQNFNLIKKERQMEILREYNSRRGEIAKREQGNA